MKTQAENLSAQQSLDIITTMIEQAKGTVQKNSFFFLLWGWVVVLANLGVYSLSRFTDYPHPYIVWLVTIPAAIASAAYGMRMRTTLARAATHLERISMYTWIGFGITCFTMVLFGYKIDWQINPVITIMCATPTFVSGVILRFKPLVVGAVGLWLLGGVSFLVSFELQHLLAALAVTLGYLIPGYMLRSHKS